MRYAHLEINRCEAQEAQPFDARGQCLNVRGGGAVLLDQTQPLRRDAQVFAPACCSSLSAKWATRLVACSCGVITVSGANLRQRWAVQRVTGYTVATFARLAGEVVGDAVVVATRAGCVVTDDHIDRIGGSPRPCRRKSGLRARRKAHPRRVMHRVSRVGKTEGEPAAGRSGAGDGGGKLG